MLPARSAPIPQVFHMSELISTLETERPRESTTERPRPLRIAQVAPLYESVPPKLYGGTERVVSYLTEELVRRGNQVTLFASGDSTNSAKLHAGYPTALRLSGLAQVAANGLGNHMAMLSRGLRACRRLRHHSLSSRLLDLRVFETDRNSHHHHLARTTRSRRTGSDLSSNSKIAR